MVALLQSCLKVATLKHAYQIIATDFAAAFPRLPFYCQLMARLHALQPSVGRLIQTVLPKFAWVYAPNHGDEPGQNFVLTLQRVQIRQRHTFDSSGTPKVGQSARAPIALADINLPALAASFQEQIDAAKENDVEELKRRIAGLKRELQDRPEILEQNPVVETKIEYVDRPLVTPEVQELLSTAIDIVGSATKELVNIHGLLNRIFATVASTPEPSNVETNASSNVTTHERSNERYNVTTGRSEAVPELRDNNTLPPTPTEGNIEGDAPPRRSTKPRPAATTRNVNGLVSGAVRILEALAGRRDVRLTLPQIKTRAKFKSVDSGTFTGYMNEHKRSGRIEQLGNQYRLTRAGFAALGIDEDSLPPLPRTAEESLEYWREALAPRAAEAYGIIAASGAGGITRGDLAERMGVTASGGTFGGYLTELRQNSLISVRGNRLVSDTLR